MSDEVSPHLGNLSLRLLPNGVSKVASVLRYGDRRLAFSRLAVVRDRLGCCLISRSAVFALSCIACAGMSIGMRTLILGQIELAGPGAVQKKLIDRRGLPDYVAAYMPMSARQSPLADRVFIGHHVVLITTNHEIGTGWKRCGALESRSPIHDWRWGLDRRTRHPSARCDDRRRERLLRLEQL